MAQFDSKQILKDLEEAGWSVARTRGSHVQLKHPDNPLLITVPHPKRDLPQDTAAAVYRAAGITPPWKATRKRRKTKRAQNPRGPVPHAVKRTKP